MSEDKRVPLDDERLLAMLREDLNSPEEAEAMLETARRLNAWDAPEVAPAATARLVEALAPAMPAQQTRWVRFKQWLAAWWPLLILRAQMRVVRGEIWTASGFVMALGVVVTLTSYNPASSGVDTLPLVLVAPVVTAMGVAFLYGPEVDPALEIQLATPVPPRMILLARLVLVFGFNLAVAVAASVVIAVFEPGISTWPVVMAWLAPMTFLSSLAFLLSVLVDEPVAAALVSMGLWGLYIVGRAFKLEGHHIFSHLPNLTAAEARPGLWLAAVLMGCAALWLAGHEERWIERQEW